MTLDRVAARCAGLYFAAVLAGLDYSVAMADTENMAGILPITFDHALERFRNGVGEHHVAGSIRYALAGRSDLVAGGLINAGLIYGLAVRSKSADS